MNPLSVVMLDFLKQECGCACLPVAAAKSVKTTNHAHKSSDLSPSCCGADDANI